MIWPEDGMGEGRYNLCNKQFKQGKQGILRRSTPDKWLNNNLNKTVYSVVTCSNL